MAELFEKCTMCRGFGHIPCGNCMSLGVVVVPAPSGSAAPAETPAKQTNPCPTCGTFLWNDPRPCWNCRRQEALPEWLRSVPPPTLEAPRPEHYTEWRGTSENIILPGRDRVRREAEMKLPRPSSSDAAGAPKATEELDLVIADIERRRADGWTAHWDDVENLLKAVRKWREAPRD